MVHAATEKREHHLRHLRRFLFDRPLTEGQIEKVLRPYGIASRTVHEYLKLLLERGDAAVVRSQSDAQDTPRYIAAYQGVPVMEEGPFGLEVRRTFGRVTYVSDPD
ncbi:MAG: hypothetical protein V3U30_03640 [Thermoplasmata archaeon]